MSSEPRFEDMEVVSSPNTRYSLVAAPECDILPSSFLGSLEPSPRLSFAMLAQSASPVVMDEAWSPPSTTLLIHRMDSADHQPVPETGSPMRHPFSPAVVQEWMNIWYPPYSENPGQSIHLSRASSVRPNTSGLIPKTPTLPSIASLMDRSNSIGGPPLDHGPKQPSELRVQHIRINRSSQTRTNSGVDPGWNIWSPTYLGSLGFSPHLSYVPSVRSDTAEVVRETPSPLSITAWVNQQSPLISDDSMIAGGNPRRSVEVVAPVLSPGAGLDMPSTRKYCYNLRLITPLTSFPNSEILMHMLQGNAVVIKLAEAYVRNFGLSTEAYLPIYHNRLLNLAGAMVTDKDRVIAAFEISFEAFEREHEEAANVLQMCAFVHNEDIRYELIRRGLGLDGESYQWVKPSFTVANVVCHRFRR